MFRDYIQNPIDPIPASYVRTLTRLNNEPDYSLTCLGIALLRSRIENYKGISGTYYNFVDADGCIQDIVERVKTESDTPVFCYYTYRTTADVASVKKKIEENGFKIKENIGSLMKTKASTDCFAVYKEERNFAAMIVNSRDIKYYHMLISFLSLLFPLIFKDKPMEEQDYNLVKSLSKNDKNVFIQMVQESVKPYIASFRKEMLQNLLKSMHESKVRSALDNVNCQRQTVRDYNEEFANAMTRLNELIVIYEGLKATESYGEPEEDLVEYLTTNDQIHNLEINDDTMTFTVATLLNNYDENAWATFASRGYIFDGEYYTNGARVNLLDVFKDVNNRKILLNNIFSESPEFAVKIAGNYTINLNRCRLSCSRQYDYANADPIFKSYLPNPHIKNFACLGGYEHRVANALADRNYIAAIEMCCASAGSVNLAETEQTFRPFLGWLMSTREKVLRRKDGVDMTPEEALVYLIDKEKTE